MTLTTLQSEWQDTEAFHKTIHEHFTELVNANTELKAHRDFVERGYGFGERSFWWLWKMILDELPESPKLLEIGVYKGATLSLWKLLRRDATCYGITPLSSEGGYGESDYGNDIQTIHISFGLDQPLICQRRSVHSDSIRFANFNKPFDVIYIDGAHDTETVLFDLNNYAQLVATGGYLVMDDANCDRNLPWGYFRGHQSVTDAKLAFDWSNFEFIASVVHISVWRRIK